MVLRFDREGLPRLVISREAPRVRDESTESASARRRRCEQGV